MCLEILSASVMTSLCVAKVGLMDGTVLKMSKVQVTGSAGSYGVHMSYILQSFECLSYSLRIQANPDL